jgi:HlyD family secretion protein
MKRPLWLLSLVGLASCGEKEAAPLYEKVAVARRDIVVSASAAGAIEPVLTVDVKSKASGEIIDMQVETGDDVPAARLLARIDPRQPRNQLAQAEANLVVARAQLENARAQLGRADTLFKTQSITEQEYETARLAHANANAQVVRAQADLELARDRMDDTQVRAPIAGTIIQKSVELGTVISSPTSDVGGGTVLFRMANLDTVQVRTLVDETDIGKVQPGLATTITVDAYPNRPFEGRVLKVEPQATVNQNVTMFPVLIRIANPGHLLKPGMNTEVEIHVGDRQNVLAIPYTALRTPRDVGSAAQVLGLDPNDVQRQLTEAQRPPQAGEAVAGGDTAARSPVRRVRPDSPTPPTSGGASGTGTRVRGGGGAAGAMAGSFIVFAMRNGRPTPVPIRTGLTDLDYIEVLSGLSEQDTVLLLPSASLVQSQRDMRERVQRMTGGGLPGVQQSQPASGQRAPQR